jgi:hypothetical protein
VPLNRTRGQSQHLGDGLGIFAGADQVCDLNLGWRQILVLPEHGFGKAGDNIVQIGFNDVQVSPGIRVDFAIPKRFDVGKDKSFQVDQHVLFHGPFFDLPIIQGRF